jgi:hypothetical protein
MYVSVIQVSYYNRAVQVINAMQQSRAKGSITLHFDGSGQVSRITRTEDVK